MIAEKIQAGDTFSVSFTHRVYSPAAGFTAKLTIYNASQNITLTSTGTAETFDISATPNATSLWVAGHYTWVLRVESVSERHTIATGKTQILPDITSSTKIDSRSNAERVLDAINATIEGRATREHSEYTIEGKSVTLLSLAELIKAKSYYESVVMQEKGGTTFKKIRVEFR